MNDRNCLSYWFPKLVAAGLPVPRTEIVKTGVELIYLVDGKTPDGWTQFIAELNVAVLRLTGAERSYLSPPFFLRTGQGSGKHNWEKCCYVDLSKSTLAEHVVELVNWSHMVDFLGLAHDVWCVRELLPTTPIMLLPRYGNMPLVREYRGFVKDGRITCVHPYWPEQAIRDGLAERKEAKEQGDFIVEKYFSNPMPDVVHDLLQRVATAFADDGAWSVDVLETKLGWYVTDMAEAHRSFHWEGCPKAGAA